MWKKLSTLLNRDEPDKCVDSEALEKLRLATAALLFRAGNIDGFVSEIELEKLEQILKKHFDLSDAELQTLVIEGMKDEARSVDLYGFTRIITDQLDQAGRIAVIELIWEMVLADGVIDDFEANLVWRVAELIGVSTRDRVLMKRKVMKAH